MGGKGTKQSNYRHYPHLVSGHMGLTADIYHTRKYSEHSRLSAPFPSLRIIRMKCPCDIGQVVDLSPLKCLSIVSFCFARLKNLLFSRCYDNLTQRINELTSVNNIYRYVCKIKLTVSFIFVWDICTHMYTDRSSCVFTHNCTNSNNRNDSNVMYTFAFLATASWTNDRLRTCNHVYLYTW